MLSIYGDSYNLLMGTSLSRPTHVLLAGICASVAGTLPVRAQPSPSVQEQPAPQSQRKKPDVIVAPVPFSSPSSGFGLAAGAVAFYNPNGGPHQWISGGGVVWTKRGTKGLGTFHSIYLNDDRIRIEADASYLKADDRFYGIGEEAGDRGEALNLDNHKLALKLHAQLRAFEHGFVGIRYQLLTNDAEPEEGSSVPAPPADQLKSTLSLAGPSISYDTRDSHTQPRAGINFTATWLFGIGALGNSYDHDKLTLSGKVYGPAGPDTVIALAANVCAVSGDVPYYGLCLFGSGAALRGYPSGRYRDRASWALQSEVRHRFSTRWGGVAFAGIGGIAPSARRLIEDGDLLSSVGIGVRYLPFKDNDVQLRIDIAVGKNDQGVYLGIGEAF